MDSFLKLLLILLPIHLMSSKILSIPFKFKQTKRNSYSYNSLDFLNEYYKKELLLELNIGTPPQKVNAYLNQQSYCIELKSPESISENNYCPYKSTSFAINEIQNPQNNNFRYINSRDILNINKNESIKLSFVSSVNLNLSTNKNISLIPEIGINNPLIYYGYLYTCNNLIYDLRSMNSIDKKIFSVKCNDKFGGEFILGNDLTKYNSIHFKEEKYYTKYFSWDFMFIYDNIYIKNSLNKIEYLNITGHTNKKEAIININSGLIIGTEEFRNLIHRIFFEDLIEKNICILDLIEFSNSDYRYGNEFYVYNCNHKQFTGQDNQMYNKKNYYLEFPNLIFNSKSFEYDFELTNNDLFEQIYTREYFLIIFPKIIKDKTDKDIWLLGAPFYKKYPFTINLVAKTLGFYLNKKEINPKINETKSTIGNDKDMENNNSKIKNIIIKISEVLLGLGLLFLAYYIGMKVKEQRKKRANELKDDNYEYISDDNKDINQIENGAINKQFVELNSKLGL